MKEEKYKENGKRVSKKADPKRIAGILFLILFAGVILFFGYRVIMASAELPGRLVSVPSAAANAGYFPDAEGLVHKIAYSEMKYGFIEDILLAQMDYLDRYYEEQQLEEVHAVNDLIAMSLKTADKLAYERAKEEQEKAAEQAKQAALLAERAKQQKMKELAEQKVTPKTEFEFPIDIGDDRDTGSGSTKSNGGKKGEPVYAESHGKSLGKYVITAYCTCKICCGIYSGRNRTASGTVPTTNRTLAVDTDVIPFGTKLVINGQVYVAEDRGGAIKGKRIDMFFYTHKEAMQWGRRKMEVFLAD